MEALHWTDYFRTLVPPIVTITLFAIGFFAGFVNWKRQKKKEIEYGMEVARFDKRIESCKAIWGLLAYMSHNENQKTIFVYRGTKDDTAVYARRKQAQEFLTMLPEVFYEQGHGILMPKGVRDEAYHFRRIVYKLLDADRSDSQLILLKTQGIISKVTEIRESLGRMLKEEANRNPKI